MALACTYRLVTDHPRTSLGLPEVNLGILPGWGGTQRLPRVVGLAQALAMILPGKPVNGRKAKRIGLADGIVVEPFLEEQTNRFIDRILTRSGRATVLRRRRKVQPLMMRMMEHTALGRRFMCRKAEKEVRRKTKGQYPAPLEALYVLRRTYRRGTAEENFACEADAFSRLACTSISRNLVRLFHANQRMKKSVGADPVALHGAGVIGAGIMGSGIAWALSNAGLRVRLRDMNWPAVSKGMASAAKMYRELVTRRKMTESEMNLAMHRLSATTDYTGFANADIVIEAVAEDIDIKRQVLRDIEKNVRPDTIIATNTSSLSMRELASVLKHPKRFVGLHFFNPVNRMQLVEVVPCRQTSGATVAAAANLVRQMGKLPIVVGDCAGFLVNRILLPYLVESAWMFEEGVDAERLDRVLERFGMPMGPLTLADEVGLDVGYKVAKVLEDAYGPRMRVANVLGNVAGTGTLLGRKSGQGFYIYHNGHKKPNDEAVRSTNGIRQNRLAHSVALTDDEIVDRAILIMVNEAARCLDERVIEDPEQLDMAMVMGTGFAPFRGGLLRYADDRGVERITARLDELAMQFGDRFKPVPMLTRMSKTGSRFYHDASA